MRSARSIGRAPPVVVNFLEDLLYLGHQRSKIPWLFQSPKRNISRPEVVVHNGMDEANSSRLWCEI